MSAKAFETPTPVRRYDQAVDSACSVHFGRDLAGGASLEGANFPDRLSHLPEVGSEVLGFAILAEIGRGSFGRVYLARQGELAGRLVVLKVSSEVIAESQKLAQLQHTHIVPVYSLHQYGPLQAVCMPYLGTTTLADILREFDRRESLPQSGAGLVSTLNDRKSRSKIDKPTLLSPDDLPPRLPPELPASLRRLESLSYVDAVLWIASCLADALAHAHERGIFHRDLKPANILLTDDGQPMLLDFNLAEDIKRPSQEAAGGTLPYMAPEHLASFVGMECPLPGGAGKQPNVDARSDLYSLGVVLFELLTGRHPFARHQGATEFVVPRMISERLHEPPPLTIHNPAISPAAESIIRRCLQPLPEQRYQSALELREDLDRHQQNLPLRHAPEPSLSERCRKWAKRHPRLSSAYTVSAIAAALIVALMIALFVRGQRLNEMQAREELARFREDMQAAKLLLSSRVEDEDDRAEGRRLARQALDRFHVLDDNRWAEAPLVNRLPPQEKDKLPDEVGELLLLLSASSAGTKPARELLRLNDLALASYRTSTIPRSLWHQRAAILRHLGQQTDARKIDQELARTPSQGAWDDYILAHEDIRKGKVISAIANLKKCLTQDSGHVAAWFLLGNCYLDGFGDRFAGEGEAINHYTACLALQPDFVNARYNRGLAYLRIGKYSLAEADFSWVIDKRPLRSSTYTLRALAREGLTRFKEAKADLDTALNLGAPATRVCMVRARVRLALQDDKGASRDADRALAEKPTDEEGWVARGWLRARKSPKEALSDFREAEKLQPRSLSALRNQACILAESLNKPAEAVEVMDRILKMHPELVPVIVERGVVLARMGKRTEAHHDALLALKLAPTRAAVLYQVAGIFALTSKTHKADAERAITLLAKGLRGGHGHDLIGSDPDLKPLAENAGFKALVTAAKTVQQHAMTAPR